MVHLRCATCKDSRIFGESEVSMSVQSTNPGDLSQQSEPLFAPYQLGNLTLSNRMVMAPMTRSRATGDGVPHPLAKIYYAQRASAGLIVTEATHASLEAASSIRRGYILLHKLRPGRK